jgi:hypothetical protein
MTTVIFVFHSKGELKMHAQMFPLLAPQLSQQARLNNFRILVNNAIVIRLASKSPQPCIVASVLWDARVAK